MDLYTRKNIHLYILFPILLIFLSFFTYHVQSIFIEPFFISTEQNETTKKVDLKEDIQINRDKFEESISTYFGMKQAKVDTNTKLPDSNDAVEDSFT